MTSPPFDRSVRLFLSLKASIAYPPVSLIEFHRNANHTIVEQISSPPVAVEDSELAAENARPRERVTELEVERG